MSNVQAEPSTPIHIKRLAYSPMMQFWKQWRKQKSAFIAGIFIMLLVVIAVFAPQIAPYDPYAPDYGNVLSGPSTDHWQAQMNMAEIF